MTHYITIKQPDSLSVIRQPIRDMNEKQAREQIELIRRALPDAKVFLEEPVWLSDEDSEHEYGAEYGAVTFHDPSTTWDPITVRIVTDLDGYAKVNVSTTNETTRPPIVLAVNGEEVWTV